VQHNRRLADDATCTGLLRPMIPLASHFVQLALPYFSAAQISMPSASSTMGHRFDVSLPRATIMPLIPPTGVERLRPGWTDVIYDQFHKVWPSCALRFQRNRYVHKQGSTTAYWKGDARCIGGSRCIYATFAITFPEPPNDTLDLVIDVHGTVNHADGTEKSGRPMKRKLTGVRRQQLATQLNEAGMLEYL
jgi:hypothetical protein